MTPEKFVLAIKQAAFDSAVAGTIDKLRAAPPGRGPHLRRSALSLWYNELAADDQQMVMECVRDAAHAAVFGVLCVLDGVRVIDDPPHVDLRLTGRVAARDVSGGRAMSGHALLGTCVKIAKPRLRHVISMLGARSLPEVMFGRPRGGAGYGFP